MISLIEKIDTFGFSAFFLCVAIGVLLVISVVKTGKEFLSVLGLKSERLLKEQSMDNRMSIIEDRMMDLESTFSESKQDLSEQLKAIADTVNEIRENENETAVALFRSSLWRLHKDFTEQGFVTPDGLKTFAEMGKKYEKAGGDDIYHEKLLPEVSALEIHYPDGSIYSN